MRGDTDPILRFHGAAHGVTGSCYEIETLNSRILVDCGLFQGSKSERELNYGPFPFPPEAIDAVILTAIARIRGWRNSVISLQETT
jgi:metallo-beta-lactamase family protein